MASLFGDAYDDVNDAAEAASTALARQPSVNNSEYAALLVRDQNGKFLRTRFNTANMAGQAPIDELFNELEPGQVPVGVIHNHPGGPLAKFDPTFLSEADSGIGKGVKTSNGQTGPLSMYLLAKGQTRLGSDLWKRTIGPDRIPASFQSTRPILAQIPIHEIVQYLDSRSPFARAAAAVRASRLNPMTAALEEAKP